MPRYRATQKGFINGRLYGPGTKRPTVHTDMPLDPVPTWLEPLEAESPDEEKQRKRRESAQKRAATKAKKEQDNLEQGVSFVSGPAATVETL